MSSRWCLYKKLILGIVVAVGLIVTLSLAAFSQPSSKAVAPHRMTDAQLVQDLRSHLDQLAVQHKFSGAVLVAKNGKILFEHAYGFADHAFNVPNKVDTK